MTISASNTRLALVASLLIAGLAVVVTGCDDTLTAAGIGSSAQTTDALAVLPADADVYGMTNLEAARESEALDAALGNTGLGMINGRGSSDFDEFVRLTGFDPATDLDKIYVAAREGTPERAAFVAYGRFDRERIERYIADLDDADFEASTIGSTPVYIATDEDGDRGGFALASDRMVLAGDEATLTDMIGRLGSAASAPPAELQALFDRVTFPDGAWFVARLDRADITVPDDAGPSALAARAADGFVVSMAFERDGVPVNAYLSTKPEANTSDVADVVRGGLSAARMGLKDQPDALDVLDRVEVKAEDAGVRIDGFLTQSFLASAHEMSH